MSKIVIVLFFAVLWLGVFVTSLHTPLICDDNTYVLEYCHGPDRGSGFHGSDCEFKTITGKVQNLARLAVWHYTHENGRFATAVPLRLFAGLPHWMYASVNAIMFVLLCILVFHYTNLSSRWLIPVAGLVTFCLLKADAVFWMAAAINYLWPIVAVMLASVVFEKMGNGRVWNMIWAAPLSFVVAGGHEIVSVPVCFGLAFFWVSFWIRKKRWGSVVQLAMTLAFGLGTLSIFLSPVSPLFRAGYETTSTLSYMVLCKIMTLAICFVGSPALVFDLIVLFAALFCRRLCVAIYNITNMPLLVVLLFSLAFTLTFGNLGARASWPLSVLAILIFFRIAPLIFTNRVTVIFHARLVMSCLGLLVVVNTAVAAYVNGMAYQKAFSLFMRDQNNLFMIPERADWLLGFLFDRTHDPRNVVQVGIGEECMNGVLSKRLDRPRIVGLFAAEYRWLLGQSSQDGDPVMISKDKIWRSSPHHNLLVRKCAATGDSGGCVGVVIYSNANFTLRKGWEIFVANVLFNVGGLGVFKTQVFFENFARDVIYATLYKGRPVKGFYVTVKECGYQVMIHNRFAYRENIVEIK